jgi:6-hydroxycyclohex-1-ene-1-carbonyl-CoA dehydrogenase
MKAALLYQNEKFLRIEEVEKPVPQNDEILLKVLATGVCHTDLHYLEGVPTFKKPPIILGHEVLGEVIQAPKDDSNFSPTDKVIVPPIFTCGKCNYCRIGRENICQNLQMYGNHLNGGYAEYMVAKAKDCIKVDKNAPLEFAIISDAVSTPYYALTYRAKVTKGNTVAIFGCGGLGLNAIQIAKFLGANVIAVDINQTKLNLARNLGADKVFLNAPDIVKLIRKECDGGVDIAVDAIGHPEILQTAFATLKPAGKLVVLGYTDKDATFNAGRIMFRELEIIGSLGCPPSLYPSIYKLVEGGFIKVKELVTHKFPLEKINDALKLLTNKEPSVIRSIVVP